MPEFYVLCGADEDGAFPVEPYGYYGGDTGDLPQEYMRRGTLADLADKAPYIYTEVGPTGELYATYRDPRQFASELAGFESTHSHLLRVGILKIE